MGITKVVKPFIKRGWPNTFGNIVYVKRQTCQKRNKIAEHVWTAHACHSDLLSARLKRKQRSASLERVRLLKWRVVISH